ncbi:Uncharacterized protein G5I_02528 [Acromyrmex echinatior]|uniref:Uncharacterized protein n=1 Tax=Acromyrmex echinatior TaxID=103372 RepID=F4WAJ1_ACREC|nr:Uncharacterized protein G5I_02528 [Acromyrmex echinatior]
MGKGFANVDPLSSWRFSECAEYAKLTDDTCTDVGVLRRVVLLEVVGKEGWFTAKGGSLPIEYSKTLCKQHTGMKLERWGYQGLVQEHEREEGEVRWCRITAGIVKSRHGEEEEKAATGVEMYKNSDTRAGTVDKTKEIGKTAKTSLKQKRDKKEEEEEEEEVIRNTVREYNTTSIPE